MKKSKLNIPFLTFAMSMALFAFACGSAVKEPPSKSLKQKIEEGLDKEQEIRKRVIDNMKRDTFDAALNQEMEELDSINLVNVKAFLKENGYPSISKHGKKLARGVFFILQHGDTKTMEQYVDQLKERAFEGEASKKHYAMMRDRIMTEYNLPQIYGTQVMPRKDANGFVTNEYYVWPIENVAMVDSLRKEMGFDRTVAAYAKDLDAVFDPAETLPSSTKE